MQQAEMPQKMDVITTKVWDDEPCFSLREENRPSRSGKNMCRWQIMRVVRDDKLVTACVYLGLADQFLSDQFQLVGGVLDDDGKGVAVHTVAELREGAEELRSRPPHRTGDPTDLASRYVDHMEEMVKQQNHRSTFGSHSKLVRI